MPQPCRRRLSAGPAQPPRRPGGHEAFPLLVRLLHWLLASTSHREACISALEQKACTTLVPAVMTPAPMPVSASTSWAVIPITPDPIAAPVAIPAYVAHVAGVHSIPVAVGTWGRGLGRCGSRKQGTSGSNDQCAFHRSPPLRWANVAFQDEPRSRSRHDAHPSTSPSAFGQRALGANCSMSLDEAFVMLFRCTPRRYSPPWSIPAGHRLGLSSRGARMMRMRRWSMALLAILSTAAPAGAQENRRIVTRSGEIRIPSRQELEREVFSSPRGNLSAVDDVVDGETGQTDREIDREIGQVDRELDRRDREIDRLLMRGICKG